MGISYQIIRYQHSKAALSITRPYCGCMPGMKENFTPRGGGLSSPQRATVLAAQASEPKFKVPEATGKLLWPLMLGPPALQKAETGGLIVGLAGCPPFSLRVSKSPCLKGERQRARHPASLSNSMYAPCPHLSSSQDLARKCNVKHLDWLGRCINYFYL